MEGMEIALMGSLITLHKFQFMWTISHNYMMYSPDVIKEVYGK